jgi:allantoin racemase
MKLLLINPNTCVEMTESIRQAALSVAQPDTNILAVNPERGPASVETFYDEAFAVPQVVRLARRYEGEVDAIVLACFNDPALYAVRELTCKPVLGIAQSAMLMSTLVAHRFSLISLFPRDKILLEELLQRYGMEKHCASIRVTGLSVLECEQAPEKADQAMKEAGRAAVREDGAEALVLGCAGMAGFARELQAELKVPVIDGVSAAVKLAESLVRMNISTSKAVSFDYPIPKFYTGMEEDQPFPRK